MRHSGAIHVSKLDRIDRGIGRFLDRVSFIHLATALVGLVLISALAYWSLSYTMEWGIVATGITDDKIGFWDSIHFSVVTVTSLGYGDYAPRGLSRVFAHFEVILGLTLFSTMLAKVASERSSQLIKLVYSSDTERRLTQLVHDVKKYQDELLIAYDSYDQHEIKGSVEECQRLTEGIVSYFAFQIQVGMLTYGNQGVVKRLLYALSELCELSISTGKQPQIDDRTRKSIIDLLFSISRIANITQVNYTSSKIIARSAYIIKRIELFNKLYIRLNAGEITFNPYGRTELTPQLLNRVELALPSYPWPKSIHRIVASKLGISNSLADKAIHQLVDDGVIFEPYDSH